MNLNDHPTVKQLRAREAGEYVSAKSGANLEFHQGVRVDDVNHRVVLALEEAGIRAVNPAMGFPMEMYQFPHGGTWVVSHMPVAVAAGWAIWASIAMSSCRGPCSSMPDGRN